MNLPSAVSVTVASPTPTLTPVTSASFTMTGYEVGSKIVDLAVSGTNTGIKPLGGYDDTPGYAVDIMTSTSTSKVPKNSTLTFEADGNYYLGIILTPEDGYTFTGLKKENVTLNGVAANNVGQQSSGSNWYAVFKLAALTAPTPPAPPAHTHTYGDWSKDATNHWHECTDASCTDKTGSVKDSAAHVYDDDADTDCNICGYVRTVTPPAPPAHTHTYGEWSKDSTNHWHECTDASCTDKTGSVKDSAAHVYDDDADTDCNICGYVRTVTPSTPSKPSSSGKTSYAITVKNAKNGDVTVDRKSAGSGTTVTVTVAPDKGYTLETLTVLDKNGKEVKLTAKNGKYTFTMPAGKVSVEATFMDDNTMLNFFTDVPMDAYYYDAVLWAVENGITNGTSETTFSPDMACTRAQIVTFLWRAAGSPEPKAMSSFEDVPADAYYAKAVAWAVENNITSGMGDGKFAPDATCTRAQCVTFLYRAAGSPAVSDGAVFSDVNTASYYADAVSWAAQQSITDGIGGGLFGSDNDCTRAQIVTFLYRSVAK